jgi:glycosyltransferase involved in cell wall biosynthesis
MVAMEAERSGERQDSSKALEQLRRELAESSARMVAMEAERSGERQDSSKALEQLRRELEKSSARMVAVEAELSRERKKVIQEARLAKEQVKKQLSYRLGAAIVSGSKTVRGIIRLPISLLTEYRSFKANRGSARLAMVEGQDTARNGKPTLGPTEDTNKPRTKLGAPAGKLPSTRLLDSAARDRGSYGVVAYLDQLSVKNVSPTDQRSFERLIAALVECKEFSRCIAAIEGRYGTNIAENVAQLDERIVGPYARSLLRLRRADDAVGMVRVLVEKLPENPKYCSLLGYLLAGHQPAVGRDYLRKALRLGGGARSDAVLIYRTLRADGLPLQDLESDLAVVSARLRDSRDAEDHFAFVRSTIALTQKNPGESVAQVNKYFAGQGLAPVRLIDPERSFCIDNLTSTNDLTSTVDGPQVTVLMTTFNSEAFVGTALRSILEQTYKNIELLVIDDCSTDGTREKLLGWAEADQRIRLLFNNCNVGTYASKNLGLLHARGEFITCHDSDDWSHSERLARQVSHLQKSGSIACLSKWARIDEHGAFQAKRWGSIIHFNPASLLYRRSLVDLVGFYDCVRAGADSEFQTRIQNRFGKSSITQVPAVLCFGRIRSDSLTEGPSLGFDEFGSSPVREAYWSSWGAWQRSVMIDSPEKLCLAFPPTDERLFEAPAELLCDLQDVRTNVNDVRPVEVPAFAEKSNLDSKGKRCPLELESEYWQNRKNSIYLAIARDICMEYGHSAKTVLDVGSNGTPTLEWYRNRASHLVSLDLRNPYVAEGVESLKANFLNYQPTQKFDLVTCFQVLEHVRDAKAFAKKLLAVGSTVVVSVPYRWPAGSCNGHIHDPVDEEKMRKWFEQEPVFSRIATEPGSKGRIGKRRLIQIYRHPLVKGEVSA